MWSRVAGALYSLGLAGTLLVTSPWWLAQMRHGGKYRQGWRERIGQVPPRVAPPRTRSVWVHAVSVGEVLAASRLVEELAAALPETPVYVSTTTRTGQALARERFGADRVFYFPLDFRFAVRRWLGVLQPSLVVLVESEFWPRMLRECRRAGVPVAVVNARISDRSWPRYLRLRRFWRPLLSGLALALAQSAVDAERLRALGVPHAHATGNLKYDIRATQNTGAVATVRSCLPAGVPVVVCGSTLEGEEAVILDALSRAQAVTILAPRHPERFAAVAQLLTARGVSYTRRSQLKGRLSAGNVLLLDTIGELASLYALATVAVVGGGFLHPGGHNPLEPAQHGVPIVLGPGYGNFREIVAALRAADALRVAAPPQLPQVLAELLADPELRHTLGGRAQQVCTEQAGATARTVDELVALVGDESRPGDEPANRVVTPTSRQPEHV